MFAGELLAAFWADSTALLADSADNMGDVLTYAISVAVVGGALRQRARAAAVKGWIQVGFGSAILLEAGRKLLFGLEPIASIMVIAASLALVGNALCLRLLTRDRGHDINMRSVWLCSRNDVIGNAAVILTAGLIALTGWVWLDLAVGAGVALLFIRTGVGVLAEAKRSLRADPALS
jgi:Co/Zn/Cd efflux system component